MRVKRWLGLAMLGLGIIGLGIALLNHGRPIDALAYANRLVDYLADRFGVPLEEQSPWLWFGLGSTVLGIFLFFFSIGRLWNTVTTALVPEGAPGSLVDAVHRNRLLAVGPRVVVVGGGTGLSTLLRGLKQYTSNITAVVTVADDGGSSGKLQKQLNILPPGDIRNCLVALADSESTMTDLFQFRFRGGVETEGLRDHAFGNLLIAAMSEICGGDFEQGIRLTSRVLNVRGRVLPSTLGHVRLRAEMEDGSIIEGETSIAHSPLKIRKVMLSDPDVEPLEEVLQAIEEADAIVIGPGSVFTSVIPNLLVKGIAHALAKSRAKKVYICNVMTQPGETDGFSAADHVKAIAAHVPRPVFDYVMYNTGTPSLDLLNRYHESGATLVEPDGDRIRAMGYRVLPGNYLNQTDFVRHDSAELAAAVLRLLA
jgi:uncharacterized cofD-like protein